MEVHRGEVFYADLSPVVGSEQGGIRPVLIVQNEIGNRHSPTVIAAAITSRLDKARLPTHINIRAADTGLLEASGLIWLLQPWHSNVTKRLVKPPQALFLGYRAGRLSDGVVVPGNAGGRSYVRGHP